MTPEQTEMLRALLAQLTAAVVCNPLTDDEDKHTLQRLMFAFNRAVLRGEDDHQ